MEILKIYDLISTSKLKESLDYIINALDGVRIENEKKNEFYSTLILLSARLTRIERDLILGVIEYEKGEVFKASIGKGIISLTNDIVGSLKQQYNIDNTINTKFTESSQHEIKVISSYFGEVLNTIGLDNVLFEVKNTNNENLEINIPNDIVKKLINKIEKSYDDNSKKAYQLIPNLSMNEENIKKIIVRVFTKSELNVIKVASKRPRPQSAAEELGISIYTLQYYHKRIINKFESLFPDEKFIRTVHDIANYLEQLKII